MRLSIDVDLREFDRQMDELSAGVLLASTRTANRLIERAKTSGLREVDRVYGIGPRSFEKYVRITLARDDGGEARITVTGRQLPLYHFQPRQTRRGVSVRIKGRRIVIPGAFLARMRSGHVGVFARGAYGGKGVSKPSGRVFGRFVFGKGSRKVQGQRKDGRGTRRSGLPINELYTFAAPDAFASREVTDAMVDRIRDDADKVMRQELRFALRG